MIKLPEKIWKYVSGDRNNKTSQINWIIEVIEEIVEHLNNEDKGEHPDYIPCRIEIKVKEFFKDGIIVEGKIIDTGTGATLKTFSPLTIWKDTTLNVVGMYTTIDLDLI